MLHLLDKTLALKESATVLEFDGASELNKSPIKENGGGGKGAGYIGQCSDPTVFLEDAGYHNNGNVLVAVAGLGQGC